MPETYEQHQRRCLVWRHNSFFGHVGMARQNMQSIIRSETAIDEAKREAWIILEHLSALNDFLKVRRNG